MAREKHGHYDPVKKLPDNNGQAVGLGATVWLIEQVREILKDEGDQLVEASKGQGNKRYQWLCEKLIDFGYKDIVDDYKAKKKEHASIARIEERRKSIRMLETQLNDPETPPSRIDHLKKRITQAQKYIHERERIMPETMSEKNTALAELLYDLYIKLCVVGFLGDVYLDDDDTIRAWEGDVFKHTIPVTELTSKKIDELCIAYQMLNLSSSRDPLPHCDITSDVARKIIMKRFEGRDILHWHMELVDLSTQSSYLTHSEAEDYEPGAWKIWFVERVHGRQIDENDQDMESIDTDNFYLTLPARKVNIIF